VLNRRLAVTLPLVLLALVLAGCVDLSVLRRIPSPGDELVYVGQDGNLYGLRINGGQPHPITQGLAPNPAERYFRLWPTISPDGQRLAYMRATLAGESVVGGGIYVMNLDGSAEVPIWQSSIENPVYYAWSHDGKALALLTTDGATVSLRLARSIGPTTEQSAPVANGSELYFAWAPDSRSLLAHTSSTGGGSSLTQVDVTDPGLASSQLSFVPSSFRSPEWSASGRYQVIAGSLHGSGDAGLYLRDASTKVLRSLGSFGPNVAFEWSPAGDQLAVAAGGPSLFSAAYSSLTVIDPASEQQTAVTSSGTFAFFWSPDGTRLAYLEAVPPDSLHWVVVNANGTKRHGLESFIPDPAYEELISYFDQFAQSLAVWSTDGDYLVFTGWPDALAAGSNERSHVYVTRADGGGIVRDLANSTSAFWRHVVVPVGR
jgi:Tol biopolymer transport system component